MGLTSKNLFRWNVIIKKPTVANSILLQVFTTRKFWDKKLYEGISWNLRLIDLLLVLGKIYKKQSDLINLDQFIRAFYSTRVT